jgi:hypothetical protein
VRALVVARRLGAVLVGVGQHRADLRDGELVVAGPRLRPLQRADPVEDRGAVLVLALVRVDLREVDLRELGEPPDDLVGGQVVVAGDGQVVRGGDGALDGALGPRRARHLARLAGGAARLGGALLRDVLGRLGRGARRVGGARGGDVVGAVPLDVGAHDGVRQLRDLAQHALEHLLLVGADRGREPRGGLVADGRREPLERGVGGDLERLGRGGVLGVLEDLLLAARAAKQVDRRLRQRERLRDHGLGEAEAGEQRVAAPVELADPGLDALGVVARLPQVLLERGAIPAAGRHRDLGLEHAHEADLARVRFVEVLHDLLGRPTHGAWTSELGANAVDGRRAGWAPVLRGDRPSWRTHATARSNGGSCAPAHTSSTRRTFAVPSFAVPAG